MKVTNLKLYLERCQGTVVNTDLRLDDFRVCQLFAPYLIATTCVIEDMRVFIGDIEITPAYVRAYVYQLKEWPKWGHPPIGYYQLPGAPELPTFVQKDLPSGLYAQLLALSNGPFHPFPNETPTDE